MFGIRKRKSNRQPKVTSRNGGSSSRVVNSSDVGEELQHSEHLLTLDINVILISYLVRFVNALQEDAGQIPPHATPADIAKLKGIRKNLCERFVEVPIEESSRWFKELESKDKSERWNDISPWIQAFQRRPGLFIESPLHAKGQPPTLNELIFSASLFGIHADINEARLSLKARGTMSEAEQRQTAEIQKFCEELVKSFVGTILAPHMRDNYDFPLNENHPLIKKLNYVINAIRDDVADKRIFEGGKSFSHQTLLYILDDYYGYSLYLMSDMPHNLQDLPSNTMYLEKVGEQLRYLVRAPDGQIVNGFLDIPVDNDLSMELLNALREQILTQASKKGHVTYHAAHESRVDKDSPVLKLKIINNDFIDVLFYFINEKIIEVEVKDLLYLLDIVLKKDGELELYKINLDRIFSKIARKTGNDAKHYSEYILDINYPSDPLQVNLMERLKERLERVTGVPIHVHQHENISARRSLGNVSRPQPAFQAKGRHPNVPWTEVPCWLVHGQSAEANKLFNLALAQNKVDVVHYLSLIAQLSPDYGEIHKYIQNNELEKLREFYELPPIRDGYQLLLKPALYKKPAPGTMHVVIEGNQLEYAVNLGEQVVGGTLDIAIDSRYLTQAMLESGEEPTLKTRILALTHANGHTDPTQVYTLQAMNQPLYSKPEPGKLYFEIKDGRLHYAGVDRNDTHFEGISNISTYEILEATLKTTQVGYTISSEVSLHKKPAPGIIWIKKDGDKLNYLVLLGDQVVHGTVDINIGEATLTQEMLDGLKLQILEKTRDNFHTVGAAYALQVTDSLFIQPERGELHYVKEDQRIRYLGMSPEGAPISGVLDMSHIELTEATLTLLKSKILRETTDRKQTFEDQSNKTLMAHYPLHMAVFYNRLDMVPLLIQQFEALRVKSQMSSGETALSSQTPTAYTEQQYTPFELAIVYGSIEMIKLLLRHGASIAPRQIDGYTPLHLALAYGRIDVANYLLTNHPNIDIHARTTKGYNVLHLAAMGGRVDVIKWLQSRKFLFKYRKLRGDIDAVSGDDQSTALSLAIQSGHKHVVALLLDLGADPLKASANGYTPLHWALKYNHPNIVEQLLSSKRVRDSIRHQDVQLISLAVNLKQRSLLEQLYRLGMKVRAPELLREAVSTNDIEAVRLLLGERDNFEQKDSLTNNTLLHDAIYCGADYEIIKLLVDASADVNARNRSFQTPLMVAIARLNAKKLSSQDSQNLIKSIEYLLGHGADFNISEKDNSNIQKSILVSKNETRKFFKKLAKSEYRLVLMQDLDYKVCLLPSNPNESKKQRNIYVKKTEAHEYYHLRLMSDFPKDDLTKAAGQIYIDAEAYRYVVLNSYGQRCEGDIPRNIDLSSLSSRLSSKALKAQVLMVTSAAHHTNDKLIYVTKVSQVGSQDLREISQELVGEDFYVDGKLTETNLEPLKQRIFEKAEENGHLENQRKGEIYVAPAGDKIRYIAKTQGYEVCLKSQLSNIDEKLILEDKVYIDENSRIYIFRDFNGNIYRGELPGSINLEDVSLKLTDESFHQEIRQFISTEHELDLQFSTITQGEIDIFPEYLPMDMLHNAEQSLSSSMSAASTSDAIEDEDTLGDVDSHADKMGRLYIDAETREYVYFLTGPERCTGKLPETIDLNDLQTKLNNPDFRREVLSEVLKTVPLKFYAKVKAEVLNDMAQKSDSRYDEDIEDPPENDVDVIKLKKELQDFMRNSLMEYCHENDDPRVLSLIFEHNIDIGLDDESFDLELFLLIIDSNNLMPWFIDYMQRNPNYWGERTSREFGSDEERMQQPFASKNQTLSDFQIISNAAILMHLLSNNEQFRQLLSKKENRNELYDLIVNWLSDNQILLNPSLLIQNHFQKESLDLLFYILSNAVDSEDATLGSIVNKYETEKQFIKINTYQDKNSFFHATLINIIHAGLNKTIDPDSLLCRNTLDLLKTLRDKKLIDFNPEDENSPETMIKALLYCFGGYGEQKFTSDPGAREQSSETLIKNCHWVSLQQACTPYLEKLVQERLASVPEDPFTLFEEKAANILGCQLQAMDMDSGTLSPAAGPKDAPTFYYERARDGHFKARLHADVHAQQIQQTCAKPYDPRVNLSKVNLRENPGHVNKTPNHGADHVVAKGDAHGNPVNMLHFLIYEGIVRFIPEEGQKDPYVDFAERYAALPANGTQNQDDIKAMTEIIAQLQLGEDHRKFAIFIGDTFCDRGKNDALQVALYRRLHDLNVKFQEPLSNHNAGLLEFNERVKARKSKVDDSTFFAGQYDICLMSELNPGQVPERGKLYLEKKGNQLNYVVLTADGHVAHGVVVYNISEEDLAKLRSDSINTQDAREARKLGQYKKSILDRINENGHTYGLIPKDMRKAVSSEGRAIHEANFESEPLESIPGSRGQTCSLDNWRKLGLKSFQQGMRDFEDFYGAHNILIPYTWESTGNDERTGNLDIYPHSSISHDVIESIAELLQVKGDYVFNPIDPRPLMDLLDRINASFIKNRRQVVAKYIEETYKIDGHEQKNYFPEKLPINALIWTRIILGGEDSSVVVNEEVRKKLIAKPLNPPGMSYKIRRIVGHDGPAGNTIYDDGICLNSELGALGYDSEHVGEIGTTFPTHFTRSSLDYATRINMDDIPTLEESKIQAPHPDVAQELEEALRISALPEADSSPSEEPAPMEIESSEVKPKTLRQRLQEIFNDFFRRPTEPDPMAIEPDSSGSRSVASATDAHATATASTSSTTASPIATATSTSTANVDGVPVLENAPIILSANTHSDTSTNSTISSANPSTASSLLTAATFSSQTAVEDDDLMTVVEDGICSIGYGSDPRKRSRKEELQEEPQTQQKRKKESSPPSISHNGNSLFGAPEYEPPAMIRVTTREQMLMSVKAYTHGKPKQLMQDQENVQPSQQQTLHQPPLSKASSVSKTQSTLMAPQQEVKVGTIQHAGQEVWRATGGDLISRTRTLATRAKQDDSQRMNGVVDGTSFASVRKITGNILEAPAARLTLCVSLLLREKVLPVMEQGHWEKVFSHLMSTANKSQADINQDRATLQTLQTMLADIKQIPSGDKRRYQADFFARNSFYRDAAKTPDAAAEAFEAVIRRITEESQHQLVATM